MHTRILRYNGNYKTCEQRICSTELTAGIRDQLIGLFQTKQLSRSIFFATVFSLFFKAGAYHKIHKIYLSTHDAAVILIRLRY